MKQLEGMISVYNLANSVLGKQNLAEKLAFLYRQHGTLKVQY
jgi:hypothetical protein